MIRACCRASPLHPPTVPHYRGWILGASWVCAAPHPAHALPFFRLCNLCNRVTGFGLLTPPASGRAVMVAPKKPPGLCCARRAGGRAAVRALQPLVIRGPEQATQQRAMRIYRAAAGPDERAVEPRSTPGRENEALPKWPGFNPHGCRDQRDPLPLVQAPRHRPATIVAAGLARNLNHGAPPHPNRRTCGQRSRRASSLACLASRMRSITHCPGRGR